MADKNKHIEEYLDYYCDTNEPGFAVLIKGNWGSGKTWLVKKYIEKIKEKNKKVIYVSLYGLSSTSEIEDVFFQQLHPLLSSKAMAITGRIVKGALKFSTNIDLNKDGKDDVNLNSQVPDMDNIPGYLKNTEECIIVFDDLERSGFKIEHILGYINHFVEHQGLRVVLVANEKEIKDKKSYDKIKEKLIGKAFEMIPDVDNALENFFADSYEGQIVKFFRENSEIIKEIYDLSKYKNLRHLKQSLSEFKRLFEDLPSDVKKNKGLMVHLLKLSLAFLFDIRNNKIEPNDIKKIKMGYFIRSSENKKKQSREDAMVLRYVGVDFSELILSEDCWIDFLDKGILDKDLIKKSILSSIYYKDKSSIPSWKKLWHFRYLEDKEFKEYLKEVLDKVNKKEYKEIGVLRHVFGLLLWLSDNNFYDKNKKKLLMFLRIM